MTAHPRVLVVAGANSQVRIAQTFIGAPDAVYFNNAVAEVVVGEGAIVDYYTDQRESERAYPRRQHPGARRQRRACSRRTRSRPARRSSGTTSASALKGEGADCTMNGVYLADGERLLDTHTSLDHAMPHCTSHEIYKGILAGKAKAVFNGRIIVRIDAQKTDAKQTNRALLLSDDATINSNPQLEIFADDVKCTHGAAVGQLDEEAMFYLQARGLTRVEARDMLLHAFAGEVIEGLKIPALREQIEANFFTTLARDVAVRPGHEHAVDQPGRHEHESRQRRSFDVAKVRADFPILSELVHGKPLVYLDSANTSQKPLAVIKATDDYYRHANANIHRATHLLSERATALYEGARKKAATFLNAADPHTIVLTKGTTDGINLVAQSYGRSVLKPGDEILLSWLEHHSNIVPWQLVAEQTGAAIKVVPINERGEIDQDEYARLLSSRTKIVAVGHVSNALGTINPVKAMIAQAHAAGAVVLVDGAQAAPHLAIDVQDLDCDFYVLSSHKMFGPTGTGVLYGRKQLLEAMPPYQGGGDMIANGHVREDALQPGSLQVRSGHAEHRRRRRLRRGDRLPVVDRSRRPRWRTRTTCSPTRPRRSARFPARASSARRATRPACCRS